MSEAKAVFELLVLRTAKSAGCLYCLSMSNGELCSRIAPEFLRGTEHWKEFCMIEKVFILHHTHVDFGYAGFTSTRDNECDGLVGMVDRAIDCSHRFNFGTFLMATKKEKSPEKNHE